MRKGLKRVALCFTFAALIWCGSLIADRGTLNRELIRLHVVANSDSREDQALKLRVRDAVTESLRSSMEDIMDVEQAKVYIRENLSKIQQVANQVLWEAGEPGSAQVSFRQEEFDTRHYETFSLPAGVYESLRITIGDGEGKNWWCVVFPTLCIPATTDGFQDVAAGAGFSQALTGALEGKEDYEIRFFLLDALGKLENILHEG